MAIIYAYIIYETMKGVVVQAACAAHLYYIAVMRVKLKSWGGYG